MRRKGWLQTPPGPPLPDRGGCVAICFTIVDKLPHEGLWRRWIEEGAASDPRGRRGSIHVHAKFPPKIREEQPWVGERTLDHSYEPEWNDVRVARAMLALLARALEDQDTQFILLCTESCVPITSFVDAADQLWAAGAKSWANAWQSTAQRATKFERESQFGLVSEDLVPPGAVWKALPGWHVLTRHHAAAIVALEAKVGGELWPAFEKVFAPEELFFPTMLALAGFSSAPEAAQRDSPSQVPVPSHMAPSASPPPPLYIPDPSPSTSRYDANRSCTQSGPPLGPWRRGRTPSSSTAISGTPTCGAFVAPASSSLASSRRRPLQSCRTCCCRPWTGI